MNLSGTVVSNNCTELTSNAHFVWSKDNKIDWHYDVPGKPTQNRYVEPSDGRTLNESLFFDLDHAWSAIAQRV